MTRKKNGNLIYYTFEDFEEYLHRSTAAQYKLCTGPRLSGFDDKEEVNKYLRYARFGWPYKEEIEEWGNMLFNDISTNLPDSEVAFEKTGAMWDIGRVIDNDPECWLHEEDRYDINRSGKGSVVRIVINTASSASVRSKAHTNRCGAIMACTKLLEKVGFHVQFEVTTAIAVPAKHVKVEFRVIAKRASELLNMNAVSFWCSRDMERKIDFGICETLPEMQVNTPTTYAQYEKKASNDYLYTDYGAPIFTYDSGDICFDRMAFEEHGVVWADPESVKQYVIKQLENQGVSFLKGTQDTLRSSTI